MTPDVLTLFSRLYDLAVSRNHFSKAEMCQFGTSGIEGLNIYLLIDLAIGRFSNRWVNWGLPGSGTTWSGAIWKWSVLHIRSTLCNTPPYHSLLVAYGLQSIFTIFYRGKMAECDILCF